jgi:hypothetical protein
MAGMAGMAGCRLPSGLFDFQEEALQHCLERLRAGKSTLLALDTGLGKTVVACEILRILDSRALVFCPSGLSQQLAAGLRVKRGNSLDVMHADTGLELNEALRLNPQILVVNWSVHWTADLFVDRDLLVLDEAHKVQGRRMKMMRACLPVSAPLLYLTAQPTKMEHFWRRRSEELFSGAFVLEKTPALLKAIGASQPKILLNHCSLHDEKKYLASLRSFFSDGMTLTNDMLCAAKAISEQLGVVILSPAQLHLVIRPSDVCPGLVSLLMYNSHSRALNESTSMCSQPWKAGLPAALNSKCLLMRCTTDAELKSVCEVPSCEGVVVHCLTSRLTSTQRNKVVVNLSTGKSVMVALRRSSQASSGAFALILSLGCAWFLKELREYLLPKLTILAADKSVDLGYNLHHHIDSVFMKRMPSDFESIKQLVGRVCRASPCRRGRGDEVNIVVNCYKNTLDFFFFEHLKRTTKDAGMFIA